ncbi:MAG: type II secretion system protein [Bdellovibrionales bacterium]|nr:type II secretion system protein [Bdellovibrionales bacterium]
MLALKNRSGFSLTEMIVAIPIAMLGLGVMATLLSQTGKLVVEQKARSEFISEAALLSRSLGEEVDCVSVLGNLKFNEESEAKVKNGFVLKNKNIKREFHLAKEGQSIEAKIIASTTYSQVGAISIILRDSEGKSVENVNIPLFLEIGTNDQISRCSTLPLHSTNTAKCL